jgi:hypothetical protein
MENRTDFDIRALVEELDAAVDSGDVIKADELSGLLFHLRGGKEADTVMPDRFPLSIALKKPADSGGQPMKTRSIKKITVIAAAAVLVVALGVTALATHLFGLSDLVMKDEDSGAKISNPYGAPPAPDGAAAPSPEDLISMQGYPDSKEYKAAAEWAAFLSGYDTDRAILNQVGNNPNEWTEKYPMYLVYSKDMADKLSEIAAKYSLALHTSNIIADSPHALLDAAAVGNFMENKDAGVNKMLGGYVYNDGTFHYDGEAVLYTGTTISYQFGNYVKGTFSDTYLNIGDAAGYDEWQYAAKSGVTVSLALSQDKALVTLDLPKSFVVINVLGGTTKSAIFSTDSITKEDLEKFADTFDFSQLK